MRRLVTIAVIALIVAGAGLLIAQGSPEEPSRVRHGVAVDIVFGTPATDELRDLDQARTLGADTVRVAVQWSGMEPIAAGQPARFYLDRLDVLVRRARELGIGVLLTPLFTPCWAAPGTTATACANAAFRQSVQAAHPRDPRDYARFVAGLAARYGDALVGIEVWNEPNVASFWAQQDAAADYADLVRASRKAVRPQTRIVAGAVAGADVTFLRELLTHDLEADVLSLHLYNDGRAPDVRIAPAFAASTVLQGLESVRNLLRAAGERRPLWITELGWNTSTQRGEPFVDGVTPAQQATYLKRALTLVGQLGVGDAVFVYRLRDPGSDPTDPQDGYGLLREDRTPKPAFAAVRRAWGDRR